MENNVLIIIIFFCYLKISKNLTVKNDIYYFHDYFMKYRLVRSIAIFKNDI